MFPVGEEGAQGRDERQRLIEDEVVMSFWIVTTGETRSINSYMYSAASRGTTTLCSPRSTATSLPISQPNRRN